MLEVMMKSSVLRRGRNPQSGEWRELHKGFGTQDSYASSMLMSAASRHCQKSGNADRLPLEKSAGALGTRLT